MKNKICINIFCYENKLIYPVHISDQKFENSMDLLIISDKIKSHYAYIKDFNKFMCNKTKNKNKKYFCKYCLQCFSSERILVEHKEICLKRNDKQTVKLKSGFIEFKICSRQIPALFKIYADFECILKSVKSNKKQVVIIQKNIKITFLAVLVINLFMLIINLGSQLFFTGVKMQLIILLR